MNQEPCSHPALRLFQQLEVFGRYPAGVAPFRFQIQGTSFFPGGVGVLSDDRGLGRFPHGGTMVLAHDWGTSMDFERYSAEGRESVANPTWRRLLPFLSGVGISHGDCFFTNFFVGVRQTGPGTGEFPGARDIDYVKRCKDFVVTQIQEQRPKLILVLGVYVPRLLAPAAIGLTAWKDASSFSEIDREHAGALRKVRFPSADHTCSVVSLVHPSYRHLNVRHRRWRKFKGEEAEVQMTRWASEGDSACE